MKFVSLHGAGYYSITTQYTVLKTRQKILCISLFVTFQTYPAILDLKECNLSTDYRIQLRPTLPIRGDHSITLRFGVTETFDHSQALTERCLITLQPGEEMEWTNISVQAVCDNTNQEFAPEVFTFSVTSFDHDFWIFGYELPAITVSLVVRRCNTEIEIKQEKKRG